MAFQSTLYSRAPAVVQNALCSLYGYHERRVRFGRRFWDRLEWLLESERWTASDIETYQDERLRELVEFAYEHVPFYRDRMRERRLVPSDIRGVADLPKLPVTTKEDVRRNWNRMIADNVDRRTLVHMHTSGTTGTSLHFYVSRASIAFRWAVWWRHRVRFGVEPGTWHVNFTGKLAVPPEQRRPPYWRWNYPMKQIVINMHHVVPDKIGAIVRLLNAHPVRFYAGYPSIIHVLAETAETSGLRFTARPEFIFMGAENTLEFQRRAIERVIGGRITDQYGFSEGCANASRCVNDLYHEDSEYGVMECADPVTLADGSVRGRILATGFASPEFPFIRYDVGDTAVWAPDDHRCSCGRHSRVIRRIEGRTEDYVVTPEGRRVMRFDYLFKDTRNVQEAQVIQREPGGIVLRIVRRPSYSSEDERLLRDEVSQWISPRLRVDFEYVTEIERERSGKFCAVKSELKRMAYSG